MTEILWSIFLGLLLIIGIGILLMVIIAFCNLIYKTCKVTYEEALLDAYINDKYGSDNASSDTSSNDE